ncbi:MAG: hypothetical protein MJH11_07785 [Lentisphaeria bacterium]|nr:hypothetical protein [Lentisphaeria bacterium]
MRTQGFDYFPITIKLNSKRAFKGYLSIFSPHSNHRLNKSVNLGNGKFIFTMIYHFYEIQKSSNITIQIHLYDLKNRLIDWTTMHRNRKSNQKKNDQRVAYILDKQTELKKNKKNTIIQKLLINQLSTNWETLKTFDALIIPIKNIQRISKKQLQALLDYQLYGGSLHILLTENYETHTLIDLLNKDARRGWGKVNIWRVEEEIAEIQLRYIPNDLMYYLKQNKSHPFMPFVNESVIPSLRKQADIQAFSPKKIIIILIIFALLVTVVERLILKKINKYHWTWITTPMIVGAFCILSLFLDYLSFGYKDFLISQIYTFKNKDGAIQEYRVHAYIPVATKSFKIPIQGQMIKLPGLISDMTVEDDSLWMGTSPAKQYNFFMSQNFYKEKRSDDYVVIKAGIPDLPMGEYDCLLYNGTIYNKNNQVIYNDTIRSFIRTGGIDFESANTGYLVTVHKNTDAFDIKGFINKNMHILIEEKRVKHE